MSVEAVQQIRRMRGGAQSHLMLASDSNLYVVKFQNNPQHLRVLTNEFLATRLAQTAGLTVPDCEVIEVGEGLIANTPELEIEAGALRERCKPGLHFGSKFVGGLMPGHVVDYLPDPMLSEIRNVKEFAGMLAFDKWTCNADGRQAVFSKKPREKSYTVNFIDQGYCFNAGAWKFSDAPLRGVYARRSVYRNVTKWESFEPWLGRLESMSPEIVWDIARSVPPDWYDFDGGALKGLVENLLARRRRIRNLISDFRISSPEPFPGWMRKDVKAEMAGMADQAREFSKLKWAASRIRFQAPAPLAACIPCPYFATCSYEPGTLKQPFSSSCASASVWRSREGA